MQGAFHEVHTGAYRMTLNSTWCRDVLRVLRKRAVDKLRLNTAKFRLNEEIMRRFTAAVIIVSSFETFIFLTSRLLCLCRARWRYKEKPYWQKLGLMMTIFWKTCVWDFHKSENRVLQYVQYYDSAI